MYMGKYHKRPETKKSRSATKKKKQKMAFKERKKDKQQGTTYQTGFRMQQRMEEEKEEAVCNERDDEEVLTEVLTEVSTPIAAAAVEGNPKGASIFVCTGRRLCAYTDQSNSFKWYLTKFGNPTFLAHSGGGNRWCAGFLFGDTRALAHTGN